MKAIKLFGLIILISMMNSCIKDNAVERDNYMFIKPYCATITVGGFVGLAEKCFTIGDTVTGKQNVDGSIVIRIAAHSAVNDGPPSPNSYQEFLNVPSEYLKLTKN
jgi:hypothetical protein